MSGAFGSGSTFGSTFGGGSSGSSAVPSFGGGTTSSFGSTSAAPSFGSAPAAAPAFGATAAAPSFGSSTSTSKGPAVGAFGATKPADTAVPVSFGAPAAQPAAAPSFGASSQPAAAVAMPSFGAPAQTTATPSFGASAQPGATTQVQTPAASSASSLALTTSTTTAATSAATSAATAGQSTGDSGTRWMDPLPLDAILNKLKSQMKTDIHNFRLESKRVKKWEDKLRRNIHLISVANADVQELAKNQESLERDITNIESDRKDLEEGLLELEERVRRQMEKAAPRLGDDENDEERRRIYRMGEELTVHLDSMDATVGRLVEEFNAARGYDEDEDDTVAGKDSFTSINRILNNHHDCLAGLEFESQEMSKEIRTLREQVRAYRRRQMTH